VLFVLHCIDKAGDGSLRMANREAHLAFLKANADAVRLGGPFLSDDGSRMVGSMLVIEAEDLAAAKAWAAGDPYAKAGVFENVDIRPWKAVVGTTQIS
jgi:uncharacterized protein